MSDAITTTTAIAVYAATVASGGFAWQVYTYRRNERIKREEEATKVDVHVSNVVLVADSPRHGVSVRFVNLSRHKINVTGVSFIDQRRDDFDIVSFAFLTPEGIPQAVEPRDAGQVVFDRIKLESGEDCLDFHKPVTARVRLSTGEEFLSKAVTLLAA